MSSSVVSCLVKFRDNHLEHVLRLSELILSFAIGTATLVASFTNYWSETDEERRGLWVSCQKDAQGKCDYLPVTEGTDSTITGYFIATRVFMCFGLVCGVLASVLAVVSMIFRKGRLQLIAGVLFGCQGLWLLLGLGSFGLEFSQPESLRAPGWSYSIGWLAFATAKERVVYWRGVEMIRSPNSQPRFSREMSPQPLLSPVSRPILPAEPPLSPSKMDPTIRHLVDLLRRSDSNAAVKNNGKALTNHVHSVQEDKRRRRREEIMALKKERDSALKKVRELEKQLERFERAKRSPGRSDDDRRVKVLQDKLSESEEARRAVVKKWERVAEECDDLKLLLSLQKHMSQEKSIRAKFENKIEDLKSDLKKSERDIAGLTHELEECILERNTVIMERNDALARISHLSDENDRLAAYVSHFEGRITN